MRIQQIAPAQGWHARLRGTGDEVRQTPVVVWALVEEDDSTTRVIGLVGSPAGDPRLVAPSPESFVQYLQDGDDPDT